MQYKEEIARAVADKIRENRERALSVALTRRQEAYERLPEFKKIDQEIAKTASRISKEAVFCDDPQKKLMELKTEIDALKEKRENYLKKAGLTVQDLQPKFHCRKCEDRGYIGTKSCACYKIAVKKEMFKRSNLGKSAEKQTFNTFQLCYYSQIPAAGFSLSNRENMADILRQCQKFSENFDTTSYSLLMMGEPGLGKTHLSSAIANQLLEDGKSVIYETAGDIFSVFEAEKFSKPSRFVHTVQDYLECDLLIIDDLGSEFGTSFIEAALFNIVNSREIDGKKMIINTNLKYEELKKRYSPRIISRIQGSVRILDFYGEDIRMQKR